MAGTHNHQGGFAVPPDVAEYVAQPIAFAAGTALNTLGTGTAPGVTNQLAAIEVDEAGLIFNDGAQVNIPPGAQAKFRITLGPASHVLYDDPIRNYGHSGASHLHMFFGNEATNAHSTFASLRTRNASRSVGKEMNATGYWMPGIRVDNAFGDGKNYACRMDKAIIYYDDDRINDTARLTRIPRGLRYVLGQNMDDPLETVIKAQFAAANAAAVGDGSGRYDYYRFGEFPGNENPTTNQPPRRFQGWRMLAPDGNTQINTNGSADRPNSAYSDGFRNLDGTDPWGGAGDPANHGGQSCYLVAVFDGPPFWDGVNLWSPGGYNHFHYGFWDRQISQLVGPIGWRELPRIQGQLFFRHRGWADYQRWYLDSDAHFASLVGAPIAPGFSWHTDWMGAWQERVFIGWQTFCNGVGNSNPHVCNNGAFSDTEALIGYGTFPSYDTSTPEGMFLIPSSGTGKGPATLQTANA